MELLNVDAVPKTYLLTNNPERWQIPDHDWLDGVDATANGASASYRWSVGRTRNVPAGSRVFMLRQGPEPRGMVASGFTVSEPYPAPGFDDRDEVVWYVEIDWDVMVPFDTPLPYQELVSGVPGVSWRNLFQSGVSVDEASGAQLEDLWARYTGAPIPPRRRAAGAQGRMIDPLLRRAIEDYAQSRLTEHFESEGWMVEDTRWGHPYDAVGTRGDEHIYLEAKGTLGTGDSVLVTRAEVEWSAGHRGRCHIGIVSGIRVDARGEIEQGSGELRVLPWDPDKGKLKAITYQWETPKLG